MIDLNSGKLYVCCGAPGSGKSTFLSDIKDPNEVIVSRDKIRFSLIKPGEEYFSHEKEVYSKFLDEITKNIRKGVDVYADATHLTPRSRYLLLSQLKKHGCRPSEVHAIYFKVPLNICKERNELRKGTLAYVPEESLENMYCKFIPPTKAEDFYSIWEVDADGDISLIYEDEY